jgi:hypothetical protein
MLNLLFTFVSFAWFVASDQFRTKKYLPSILLKIMDNCYKKKLTKRNKQVNVTKNVYDSTAEKLDLIYENELSNKLCHSRCLWPTRYDLGQTSAV